VMIDRIDKSLMLLVLAGLNHRKTIPGTVVLCRVLHWVPW
jgi:hypothetical protein